MKKLHITVFDCAIKTASSACVERLAREFDTFTWEMLPAKDMLVPDYLNICRSDVYFIFGSYSDVHERLPWHLALRDFMVTQIKSGIPTLGLCFGHQLIADAFGAQVSKHSMAPLKGLRTLSFQQNFGALKQGEPLQLGVSHSYEVSTLPAEFEVLASSSECAFDALKHQHLPYYGFQAHPEASRIFFAAECPMMNSEELEIALSQGLKVIGSFLQIAAKLKA